MATTTVTLYQWKRALAAEGIITTAYQNIPADVSDPINIAWWTADTVTSGGTLYNYIQGLFGYTSAQMQALLDLAATYTDATATTTTAGTLGGMKARIQDEIARTDLGPNIADAISDAIAKYQPIRFYFNETGPDGSTFNTVASQRDYGSAADADIPYFYDVDNLFITISNNNYRVRRIDPSQFRILQIPTFIGQPYQYMFLGQQISLLPIPNTAYPMTIVGHYKLAGPTSDTETGNLWMTDAERLIRSCAKRILYQDVILDADAASACLGAENEARETLKGVTSTMDRTGMIRAMAF